MYILILTMFSVGYYVPVAMTSVPGFHTENSCNQAGAEWREKVLRDRLNTVYVCVPAVRL